MVEIGPKVIRLEDPEADYEKLKIELKAKVEEDDVAKLRAEEVVLHTNLVNSTKYVLKKIDIHFWAGSELTTYYPQMNVNELHYIRQKGTLPEGVKWGICYATGTDSTARKWLAAFDTAKSKAYAEAGPIGPIDWNVVEVKLGMSESKSEYVDPALKGKTVAQIDGFTARATFS